MSHAARIIKASKPVSGLLAVTFRCCDDPATDSVLTIHQLHRPDEEIHKDIADHQARVEQLHAHDDRAEELIKKLGSSVGDCGCK